MNILSNVFVLVSFIAFTNNAGAQLAKSSRPDLFGGFSQKIVTPVTEFDKAFAAKEGTSIQIKLSDKFSFTGVVYSSIKKYNNLSSVIIKSPALHNALLSISRRVNDDNTVTYVGRIINEQYADGYELKKDNEGNYSFNKIRTSDLIQDY